MPTTEYGRAAIELCEALIGRASVTPDDAGCQSLMTQRLEAAGFTCEAMPSGDVDNFWAIRGGDGPTLVFAGHTDVVPTGKAPGDVIGEPSTSRVQTLAGDGS